MHVCMHIPSIVCMLGHSWKTTFADAVSLSKKCYVGFKFDSKKILMPTLTLVYKIFKLFKQHPYTSYNCLCSQMYKNSWMLMPFG